MIQHHNWSGVSCYAYCKSPLDSPHCVNGQIKVARARALTWHRSQFERNTGWKRAEALHVIVDVHTRRPLDGFMSEYAAVRAEVSSKDTRLGSRSHRKSALLAASRADGDGG